MLEAIDFVVQLFFFIALSGLTILFVLALMMLVKYVWALMKCDLKDL